MPPLLAIPQELREEVLQYLMLPEYVYTSTTTANTRNLHRARNPEKTYVDTRIYLPSRFPANVLRTCKQLRQECLQYQAHRLDSTLAAIPPASEEQPMSNTLAARLGTEVSEEAERASDTGTLRITIEIQRQQRGPMGYFVPIREELSPRFMALLPLMDKVRKLRLVVWPGYDWWSGGVVQPLRGIEKPEARILSPPGSKRLDAASFAISKILEHLVAVEELSIDVLMHASEGGRWDLPNNKWEKVQPWLDGPVTLKGGRALKRVVRRLAGVYQPWGPEPFYTQIEVRQKDGKTWKVERRGDMRTVSCTVITVIMWPLLTAPANNEIILRGSRH